MSTYFDTRKASYAAQRQASQGAGITLVVGAGIYTATFDCASRMARVLGDRELKYEGDGIMEVIPVYKVPVEDMFSVLQKLAARYSIALVELVCDRNSSRFVLVWKISTSGNAIVEWAEAPVELPTTKPPVSLNLDDY